MAIDRQHIAAELLELGEMLFDTAIDVAAQRPAGEETGDAASLDEMRAAADEFFTALRLLLETEPLRGSQASGSPTAQGGH